MAEPICLQVSGLEDNRQDDEHLALWSAMLTLAISDYKNGIERRWHEVGPRGEQKWGGPYHGFLSACIWFDACTYEVGGFGWVCDLLDLEPTAVKRQIGVQP